MAPKSEPQNYQFTSLTFKMVPETSEQTFLKVHKSFEVVKQWFIEDDGMITIQGEIDPEKVMKCVSKLKKSGKILKTELSQGGECSTNLVRKKKEAASKTNNQDKGPIYPCYGGYNNYYYGGYDNGYGYDYSHGFPYPTFGNYAYYNNNHLQCGGHAADCDSYHIQKRDNSTSTSTKKPADKSSSSGTKPEKPSTVSFKKLGVHGHKEKRGCSIM